jgi:diguanylate cyclase (GGDEF)-like protein
MAENRRLRVFLCHSSTDKPAARDSYKFLSSEPWIEPWFDEESLKPGQDWEFEIEKAIDNADVVIVFLSRSSLTKEGFIQKEIKHVFDKADEKPPGTLYIIPVRVEECDVPKRLAHLHWIDISTDNNNKWFSRLLDSLESRAKDLGVTTRKVDNDNKPLKGKFGRLLSDFNSLELEHRKTKRALEIREIEVRAILAQAHELASIDSVTYLPNRRKVLSSLQEEVVRATRYSTSLSIILIELDQYNYIREARGRFDADILLREFANNIKGLIYHPNTIGRLEEGEFMIVLPASDISDAIKLVKNLFERDRSKPIDLGGVSINATVSAGVIQFLHGQEIWEELLMRADKALRIAKQNGRDNWIALED